MVIDNELALSIWARAYFQAIGRMKKSQGLSTVGIMSKKSREHFSLTDILMKFFYSFFIQHFFLFRFICAQIVCRCRRIIQNCVCKWVGCGFECWMWCVFNAEAMIRGFGRVFGSDEQSSICIRGFRSLYATVYCKFKSLSPDLLENEYKMHGNS